MRFWFVPWSIWFSFTVYRPKCLRIRGHNPFHMLDIFLRYVHDFEHFPLFIIPIHNLFTQLTTRPKLAELCMCLQILHLCMLLLLLISHFHEMKLFPLKCKNLQFNQRSGLRIQNSHFRCPLLGECLCQSLYDGCWW